MTQLVENLLAQLFDNEGNIKLEEARNFVKVPEGANDHQVEQATYLALAQLKLPEEFILDHFYSFNIYTIISEGHITKQIAELYYEELASVLIQSVANADSEMLELLMKILLEESGLTDTTKGIIACQALRSQIAAINEVANTLLANAETDNYDPESDMVAFNFNRRIYDTIFNWFIEEIINLYKKGNDIEASLLPHAKLILYAKSEYKLDLYCIEDIVTEDYLQAINYCEDIEEIDRIVKVYTSANKYPKTSEPAIGFIDEEDIK